jgi:hypothetical protein
MKKRLGPDKEKPEWTKADFKRAVPLSGLPKSFQKVISTRERGPHQLDAKKQPASSRLEVSNQLPK